MRERLSGNESALAPLFLLNSTARLLSNADANRILYPVERVTNEERAARLGMTCAQLDARIGLLYKAGWSERQIAKKFGMSNSAAHYAIKRTQGVKRKQYKYAICDGCADSFAEAQVVDGLCGRCTAYVQAEGL